MYPHSLKVGESRRFVPLEDVMARNLDVLFPDMMVESCDIFRVTRNASTERDEERAEDLLAMIERTAGSSSRRSCGSRWSRR